MNHYVYLLSSKTEEKYYIGCRSCKGSIGKDPYMGSSRVMTIEEKANCNKIILKRFVSRKEALEYEIELHNKFDVAANPLFWNSAKQTSTGFDTTGRAMSAEERTKRSEALKGHKGAKTWLGKRLPEVMRKKISESNKGKLKSEEHKEALKNAHKKRVYKAYDTTIYTFEHAEYGIVQCTQYELVKRFNLQKSNLNKIISKSRKSHKGWRIL